MSDTWSWTDLFKVDPTISDPVVAQASGITMDENGVIHQKRTEASDRLARDLVPISLMALAPALQGAFIPSVEYSPIASKMLPQSTSAVSKGVTYLGGKTQPLLGMSKSLPAVANTETSLAPVSSTLSTAMNGAASTGSNFASGLAGTAALGVAVGQGVSEPSNKNTPLKQRPKYAIGKYNQKSYKRLVELQKQYGGDLIRQKDGSYFLRNKNGSFYGNGRALNAKTGKMQNYDLWGTGRFINNPSNQDNTDVVSKVLDKNYLYGYKGKSPQPTKPANNRMSPFKRAWNTARAAWEKRGKTSGGTFTFKGKTYNVLRDGESLNALNRDAGYNTYLQSQHKTNSEWGDLMKKKGVTSEGVANNAFQRVLSIDNEGRENPVSLTPTVNLNTPTSKEISSIKVPTTSLNLNKSQTRDWLRNRNVNPYSLAGSERRALRQYLNGDTTGSGYDINLVKNLNSKYNLGFKFEHGGTINKFQQGGSMDEQQQMQQAFLQYLAQQTGAKSQQELEQIIQQMGEDGLKQAYAQFIQAMQQQQVQAAKFGAKLDYIKRLNGKCPEGMEMHYYKQGGRLCRKCIEMQANGGEVDKPVGDAIQQFKAAVSRNKKKFGNKYDSDQLAGRKPVGKDSQGRDLYLDGDGNAKPVAKHSCGSKFKK